MEEYCDFRIRKWHTENTIFWSPILWHSKMYLNKIIYIVKLYLQNVIVFMFTGQFSSNLNLCSLPVMERNVWSPALLSVNTAKILLTLEQEFPFIVYCSHEYSEKTPKRVESIFYCWLKITYDLRMFYCGCYVAYSQPDVILLNRKCYWKLCCELYIFLFFTQSTFRFRSGHFHRLHFSTVFLQSWILAFYLTFFYCLFLVPQCSMIFYNVNNFIWMNILLIHLHIQLYPINLCSNLSNKYWWEILKQKTKK